MSQTFSLLRAARQGDNLLLCAALSTLGLAWKPWLVLDLLTANCLTGRRPHLHGDTGCRALLAAGTCMVVICILVVKLEDKVTKKVLGRPPADCDASFCSACKSSCNGRGRWHWNFKMTITWTP